MDISIYECLFVLLVLCLVIQFGFWVGLFSSLLRHKTRSKPTISTPFVSVIVVFKNEAHRLELLIQRIVKQKYPSFELILVDDFSIDDVKHTIAAFLQNDLVRYLIPSKDVPGKKLALKEAVAVSKGEKIIVTDADCLPLSDRWIESVVSQIEPKTEIVLGYSPYKKEKGLLNQFIRFEAWITAIQYFSFALRKMPYMGVGRNLLYSRKIFMQAKPFKNHTLAPGDDDLFINNVATGINTSICIHPDSFVESEAKKSWLDYLNQKWRHVNTSIYYKSKHKFLLGLFAFSQIGVWFSFLFLITSTLASTIVYLLMIGLIAVKFLLSISLFKRLRQQDLIPWFVVLDVFLALYYVVMLPFPFILKKSWS